MEKRTMKCAAVRLVLACYALTLAAFLLVGLWQFAQNRLAYQSGALAPAELTAADFAPNADLEWRGDVLVSIGADPQLLLLDASRRVETVCIVAQYSQNPQMVNVFWAAPGQDYSLQNMAYAGGPVQAPCFYLPPAGGQNLRIDPGTVPGNEIAVERIVVNQKRLFYRFFVPSAAQLVLFAVVPGLVACGLWLLREAGLWPKRPPRLRRRAKKGDSANGTAGDAHG